MTSTDPEPQNESKGPTVHTDADPDASDCTQVSWHTPSVVTEIRHHSLKWLSLSAPSLVLAVKRNVVVLKGMGSDEQYCARERRPPQSCEQRGCRSAQAWSMPVRRRHRQGVVAAWGRGVRAAGADRPAASSHPQTLRARLLWVWASREAPGTRPPLPVLLPGCSTRHTLRPGKPCSSIPREGCSRNSMVWSLSNIWSISSQKATFKRLNEAILLLCYKQPISYSPFLRVEGRSFLSKTINLTLLFLKTAVFNKIQY